MRLAAYGTLIFFLAFLVQFAWWRRRLPKHHTRALAVIFLSFFAASVFVPRVLGADLIRGRSEMARYFLFYVALFFSYLATYSAVEVDSPSLLIVLKIAGAGKRGLGREDLLAALTDDVVLLPRLEDLVKDGAVRRRGGGLILSPKGRFLAKVFIFFRALLRAPKGG